MFYVVDSETGDVLEKLDMSTFEEAVDYLYDNYSEGLDDVDVYRDSVYKQIWGAEE